MLSLACIVKQKEVTDMLYMSIKRVAIGKLCYLTSIRKLVDKVEILLK
jgi:hypothetical protein